MPVEQSGSVTPGHVAVFASDNVLMDGGANAFSDRVLASLLNADFNTTADQPLALNPLLKAFQITGILITNASISLSTAVGGFYPQADKLGTEIVANTQVYNTLSTGQKLLAATLTAFATGNQFTRDILPDWAVYLSLTTEQGVAATADVYLLGVELR